MHKHNDLGFTFTVETDIEIPNQLSESFFQRMSNIDKNLLNYYTNIELNESKNFYFYAKRSLLVMQNCIKKGNIHFSRKYL